VSLGILEQFRRRGGPYGSRDTGPVYGGIVGGRGYGGADSTYLDRSYPSHTLLSPVRAQPVLDLSQNIGDKEER